MSQRPKLNIDKVYRQHPFVRTILQKLNQEGHEAVVVGGAVRDGLLNQLQKDSAELNPTEVDLASAATPEEIRKLFPAWPTIEVGKSFGVLILKAPDGRAYEIATFRTESEYDGRRPQHVMLTRSFEQDVQRRDFTINGLAARMDGTIIDLVGGANDLEQRVIRAIGVPQQRFEEDYLRLLRAVRFACQLDFQLDPEVQVAIRAQSAYVKQLSAERIRDELWRIFSTSQSQRGIKLLDELQLLQHVLPEISQLKGVPQPKKYHPEGDVFVHTALALDWADRLRLPPLSKLAVMFHDIGKPQALIDNHGEHMGGHEHIGEKMVGAIGKRFKFSSADVDVLCWTTAHHMRIAKLPVMKRTKQLRFLKSAISGNEPQQALKLSTLLHVLICDAQASVHRASVWEPVFESLVDLLVRLSELERREAAQKLLDGNDILDLGARSGPMIGQILDKVYDQIYAGQIETRDQALRAAAKHVSNLSK